jgi:ABC-2 type transport system ATP-binding protein
MEDIQRLCERILIIRDGEFVYDGPLARVKESYARHKVVTAHLRKSEDPLPSDGELRAFGEVLQCDGLCVKVRVPRADVARAAARILEAWPVADLAIEEMDIGTIIERIYGEKGRVEP